MFVEYQDYTDRHIERQIDELTDRRLSDKLTYQKRYTETEKRKKKEKRITCNEEIDRHITCSILLLLVCLLHSS